MATVRRKQNGRAFLLTVTRLLIIAALIQPFGCRSCSSDEDKQGGGIPCHADSDCPSEQICDADFCREAVYPIINETALRRATYDLDADNYLINNKNITPAGERVIVGVQPNEVVVTADGKYAVVNESTWGSMPRSDNVGTFYLRSVDLSTMEIADTEVSPTGLLSHGLDIVEGGQTTIWATGGGDSQIHEFNLSVAGELTPARSFSIPDCYTTQLVIDAAGERAFVTCLQISNYAILAGKVAMVNLATSEVSVIDGIDGAFEVVLNADASRLFVSSIATAQRPDDGDTVTVIDTVSFAVEATLTVGLGPEGLVYDAGRDKVYAVCNRTDDVYIIDAAGLTVTGAYSLHDDPAPLKGMYPVHAAMSPDGARLFVTAAHKNAIGVINLDSGEVEGFIPTAWYPNDVRVTPDGSALVVSEGRGIGEGPTEHPAATPGAHPFYEIENQAGWRDITGRLLQGTLGRMDIPNEAELTDLTAKVVENNNQQGGYFDFSTGNDTPLPSPDATEPPRVQIEHVFFILKENFSYDSIFGDIEGGDGNPDYLLWGDDVAPNQRKLAREYTMFDNFYCESDGSLDGHQWAAAGIETDFMEKYSWHSAQVPGIGFGTPAVSLTPGTVPESNFIMPHLIQSGVSVLGFGGAENFGDSMTEYYDSLVAPNMFPPLDIGRDIHDPERAEVFAEEFAGRVADGAVPGFSWIFFGDNHTHGVSVGSVVPEWYVGINDQAVATTVDAITNSPIWEKSLIFITEDDAQNGFDHVDKHRCPAVAIGPYVKRGYVSHVMYTINNFHKTVELLLGAGPMHLLDERATGMYDIFTSRADTTPYEAVFREVPEDIYQGPENDLTRMSARMDWSDIDLNPDAGELIWRYRRNTEPPKFHPYYRYRLLEPEDDPAARP